jgi:hypothetical protein
MHAMNVKIYIPIYKKVIRQVKILLEEKTLRTGESEVI